MFPLFVCGDVVCGDTNNGVKYKKRRHCAIPALGRGRVGFHHYLGIYMPGTQVCIVHETPSSTFPREGIAHGRRFLEDTELRPSTINYLTTNTHPEYRFPFFKSIR